MEYNRLVFMSPIDEEDDPTLSFGDLSTSGIRTGKEMKVSSTKKNPTHTLHVPIFMDSRIEPTLLEDPEKSYNEQPKQGEERPLFNSCISTSTLQTDNESNNYAKSKNLAQQFPIYMDSRIEPTLLEDPEKSFNEQPKQLQFEQLEAKISTAETEVVKLEHQRAEMEQKLFEADQMLLREREEKRRIDFSTEQLKKEFLLEMNEKHQSIQQLETKLSTAETEVVKLEHQRAEMEQKLFEADQMLLKEREEKRRIDFSTEQLKKEFLLEMNEKQKSIQQLETKLSTAETAIDSFDEVEATMLAENFKLQKELLIVKVKFGLITVDNAFKALGCCDKKVLEEIKSAAYQ